MKNLEFWSDASDIKKKVKFLKPPTLPKHNILYFHAVWCGPCKRFNDTVAELVNEHGAQIQKIDVDANPDIAQKYKIRSIPAIIRVDDDDNIIAQLLGDVAITDVLNKLIYVQKII